MLIEATFWFSRVCDVHGDGDAVRLGSENTMSGVICVQRGRQGSGNLGVIGAAVLAAVTSAVATVALAADVPTQPNDPAAAKAYGVFDQALEHLMEIVRRERPKAQTHSHNSDLAVRADCVHLER